MTENIESADAEQEECNLGHVTAILDSGASFEGKLTFEGTVQIGGEFKGEIFTKDTLVINKGSFVNA